MGLLSVQLENNKASKGVTFLADIIIFNERWK